MVMLKYACIHAYFCCFSFFPFDVICGKVRMCASCFLKKIKENKINRM